MVTSKEIASQNGCIAYGIRPAPRKAAVCNAAPAEEKPVGRIAKKEGEEPVPLYVFLREQAMEKSPEEKNEMLEAFLKMCKERGINPERMLKAIEAGDAEYHKILERA